MKKFCMGIGIVMFLLIGVFAVYAAVPQTINYQGYLTDTGGAPLTGTYSMVFSLCDTASGGTCPWTETQSVSVNKGILSVVLGAVTPIPLPFDTQYYLDIQVGGEQMTTRQPLTSVGYALRSKEADGVAAGSITNASVSGTAAIQVSKISGLGSLATKSLITNADVDAAAGIVDSKLATITTAGKVANSATTASSTNTLNTIVSRDASGNFSAGTITANLTGNALTATTMAANGSNCPAGQYPLGVDASGNAEGCTAAGGAADAIAPVPGSSGTITATNSGTDIVLSWTAATDNVTPQANLEYTVFYSTSNTINTVTNAEANGTVFGFPWSTNITTKTVPGLTVGTTYYFNVAVKDAGHNNAMYTTVSKAPAVPASNIILYLQGTLYSGNLGGRSGANTKCSTSSNKPAGYTNFAAFLSVNASDTIFGRQAFSGLSTSTPIRSPNGTLIANNWADLLDGSIANTLQSAGLSVGGNGWNSGSNVDGTLGDTCNAWTVGTVGSGYLGDWGSGSSTTATWIYNNTGKDGCDYTVDILCIAW